MEYVPREELEWRWDRVRRYMAADAILVFQNADLFYLTGTVQDGALWFPQSGEPILAVRKSEARAREESPLRNIVGFRRYSELAGLVPEARGELGLEFDVLPVALFQQVEKAFPDMRLVDQSMAIRRARAVKTPFEQRQIRKAAAMLDSAFGDIPGHLREGMEELELAVRIEQVMRQEGHQGLVRVRRFNMELYFGAVSFGDTASYPHNFDGAVGVRGLYPAVPLMGSRRRLGRGEPVMIDIVAGYGGYHADASRAYSVGSPSAEVLETHRFVLELNEWLESRLKAGAIPSEIYGEALERVEHTRYGPYFMGAPGNQVRFVAHGIGLELDEIPVIAPRFDEPFEAGTVMAVEPKIFFPGIGGAGVENTYIIGESGCERLQKATMDWVVV
jgi:Xaa-Pro aminopeptidase